MTCSFVTFGCSIGIFLNSAHLICRSTDISKCFRGPLRLRDNESRLYFRICEPQRLESAWIPRLSGFLLFANSTAKGEDSDQTVRIRRLM